MVHAMLIRKFLIVALFLGFGNLAYAQDASGRDPGNKPPAKAIAPPVPKPIAPKPKPAAAKTVTKPAKSVAKAKTNKAIATTRKPAPPLAVKKTPPSAAPASSRLTLNAIPNARIELAGKMSGVTGQDGKLVLNEIPLGLHSLKVTAEGYEPWSGTVEAKTAATDFTVALKKRVATGTLVITVNQPGAEVFINDKLNVKSVTGRSITVEGLLPGTHQVRAVKLGFKEWRNVVQVSAAESLPVEIVMAVGASPEMVSVPAGEFMMGNNSGPKDSSPAHPVALGNFEISRREITNQFYKSFLDATRHAAPAPQLSGWQGRDFPVGKADAPVVGITWDDAQAFCKWLSQEAGAVYRLPTEAEWERAARSVGNVYQSISVVWEWCQDWYDADYYKRKDRLSPQGPMLTPQPGKDKTPSGRVIRGGAVTVAGRAVRVFERNAAPPNEGRNDIGFRVVREPALR